LSGKADTNGNKTVTMCDKIDDHVSYMTAKDVTNCDKLTSVAL